MLFVGDGFVVFGWRCCGGATERREREERESVFYMAYFEPLDKLSDTCHQSSKKWEKMGGF